MDLTTDEQLRDAYTEAIEQYGRMDLNYWKDKLFARNLQRHEENDVLKVKVEPKTVKIKSETENSMVTSRRPGPEPHPNVVELKVESSPKRKVSARGFIYPPVIDLPMDLDDDITMTDNDRPFFDGDNSVNEEIKESPKRRKNNNGAAVTPHRQVRTLHDLLKPPSCFKLTEELN